MNATTGLAWWAGTGSADDSGSDESSSVGVDAGALELILKEGREDIADGNRDVESSILRMGCGTGWDRDVDRNEMGQRMEKLKDGRARVWG